MSRRGAAVALAMAAATVPGPVAAHAIGGTFLLPVPLWLYLAGAGFAVAVSFVVTALSPRDPVPTPSYAVQPIPAGLAAITRTTLRILGLAWWYGAIVAGVLVGDISPLPAVLLWIGIWVGLPIVAVLLGNPWPSLSPFRTTFDILEWLAARAGAERLDLGLRYPTVLARWPAVLLLAAGLWAELILPGGSVAGTVAGLMIGYTLLTLGGMLLFGPVAWLRNAELLEVELGWFGRIGPIGRRSDSRELCADCGEGCNPERCIDCPECAVAAEDGERIPVLRPWFVGLTDVGTPGWSDVAFILLILAGVTYDGLGETIVGAIAFAELYKLLSPALGATSLMTFILVETLQLALAAGAFLVAFVGAAAATRVLAGRSDRPLAAVAARYATTLLPIAGGYLIAHYLTLVIQGAIWLPSLVLSPTLSVAPPLDLIPVAAVWYVSVAAIVGGHVAGVVLAHRLAATHGRGRAALVGVPMVLLMIGYTVLSLWIIATPIVVDPSSLPPPVSR